MPSAYSGKGTDQFATEMQAWQTSHIAPPATAHEQTRLGWLKEQVRLSRAYLESQRAYPDIDKALDIISGDYAQVTPQGRSHIRINRLKRQIREIVSTISDLRLIGQFRTENSKFFDHLIILKKLYNGWYHRKQVRKALREVFQFVAVEGTGYASPRWAIDLFNNGGRGDIVLDAYGATGVLPSQIGRDHNLQEANNVTLYNETPLHKVYALYPAYRDRILPSRNQPLYTKSPMQAIQKFLSPVLSVFGIGQPKDSEPTPFPMVDLYQTYIRDMSINETGSTIAQGDPGTSWYYEVPSLGSDIDTGEKDKDGNKLFRKATEIDCLLYPLRRLIIWSDTAIFYDGTSKWWHGQVPAIQFRMDDWPWEFLGYSLVRDNAPIQDTLITILRMIIDNARARGNPPVGYSSSIDKALATKLDPTQPGQRIQLDENQGETFKPLYDPQYYDIPPWILEVFMKLLEIMDHQMGVADVQALAKSKKQVPGSDTLQQILESVGPLIKDIAANIETSIEQLVYQVMCLMFQFYTTRRKIELVGEDMVASEEWDFDPLNLIPSHMDNEDTNQPSIYGLLQRAKNHMSQFWFYVEAGSLLNLTGMTKQLMLFQARKLGLWIDQWTLFESMGIPFGPDPEGAKNVIEKYIAEKRLEIALAQEMQEAMGGQGGGKGGPPQRGRPQSFQETPKMVQKSDGSSINRTSR